MKQYIAPELTLIRLQLKDAILFSLPLPTEDDNEMPILGRREIEAELIDDLEPEYHE